MAAVQFQCRGSDHGDRPAVVDSDVAIAAVAALVGGRQREFGVMVALNNASQLPPPQCLLFGYGVCVADGTILPPPPRGTLFQREGQIFASARFDLTPREGESRDDTIVRVLDELGTLTAAGWRIQRGRRMVAALDRSVPAAHAKPDELPRVPEPGERMTDGSGVLIGVVDFGCDFAHPAFLSADGQARLRLLWDQNGKGPLGTEKPDLPGRFFGAEEINAAIRQPDPYTALGYDPAANAYAPSTAVPGDPVHGTHVLGVAAGRGVDACPAGVAPGADLAFVHLRSDALVADGDAIDVFDGVCSIFECAGERPAVVNLSIGDNSGPHDGSTIFDQALEATLAKPGRAITVAAGNARDGHRHATGQVRPGFPAVLEWKFGPEDRTPNVLRIYCEGDAAHPPVRCTVTGPGDRHTELDPHASAGVEIALSRGDQKLLGIAYAGLAPCLEGPPLQHIELRLPPSGDTGEVWKVELLLAREWAGPARFDAWVERDDREHKAQSTFVPQQHDADQGCSLGSVACGRRTICVGAYDAGPPDTGPTNFSSAGPTRDGRRKPDIVAPGVEVRAAFARGGRPVGGGLVDINPMRGAMTGTSVAAPHAAGVAALMLQVNPDLDSDRIRLGMRATTQIAAPTELREGEAEPRNWLPRFGCGRLDGAAAVAWAIAERNR